MQRKSYIEDFFHDIFSALFDQSGEYITRIEACITSQQRHPTILKSDIKNFGRNLSQVQKFLEKADIFIEDIESLKTHGFKVFLKIINFNLLANGTVFHFKLFTYIKVRSAYDYILVELKSLFP